MRDWANEPWRKLYTNESPEDAMLTWQARCVWPLLVMRCDRSGIIEAQPGARQLRMLSTLLRVPEEVVTPAVKDLLEDTRLVAIEKGFLLRNFEEAQRARKSGAQRMRELRKRNAEERASARVRDVSSRVRAETHETVPNRIEEIETRLRDTGAPLQLNAVLVPASVKPVVVVEKKIPKRISKTTTTTVSPPPSAKLEGSGLAKRHAEFLRFWNAERDDRGMDPEVLTAELLPALDRVLDHVERRVPADPDYAAARLVSNFLGTRGFHVKRLETFLGLKSLPTRLDAACAEVLSELRDNVPMRRL